MRITISIPKKIKAKLKAAADAERRSVSNFASRILDASLSTTADTSGKLKTSKGAA